MSRGVADVSPGAGVAVRRDDRRAYLRPQEGPRVPRVVVVVVAPSMVRGALDENDGAVARGRRRVGDRRGPRAARAASGRHQTVLRVSPRASRIGR